MNELALFAGAGGGILGGKLLGWRTVCAVEWETYPASVLCARQNDGFLTPFPIWDDVQTFDGKPWRGIVDVVSGGFPCQDISAAGKGTGIEGAKSSMWKHMARIIGEIKPAFAFIENSPMLRTRGLGVVLQDLAKMGYDAEWGVLSAVSVGANHKRERMWIVAKRRNILSHTKLHGFGWRQQQQESTEKEIGGLPNTDVPQQQGRSLSSGIHTEDADTCDSRWWKNSSGIHRMDDGVAARVDRLKAIGNGQVPLCAASAWALLKNRLENNEIIVDIACT
jgi:DNA (cytosine-5)-methyltransferase 1